MYTRETAAQLRQQFWTTFGQYMTPVPSAEGRKINWVNYKTGIKDLYFRMQADKHQAFIGIVLAQRDLDLQGLLYLQFEELQAFLQDTLGEPWTWERFTRDETGRTISQIYTTLPGVNVLRQEDWPQLISFFKPCIIALDEFWSLAAPTFKALT